MAQNMWADYDTEQTNMWAGYDVERSDAPEDTRTEIGKGFSSGVDVTQALGGGAVGMLGSAIDSDTIRDWGMGVYQDNMAEAGESAAKVAEFDDIHSPMDALNFALYQAGSGAATFIPMILGGGIGGVATKAALKTGVEKFIAKESAAGIAAGLGEKEAAQLAASKALEKTASTKLAGATAGAVVPSIGMESGGIFGEIYDETGQYRPGVAALAGTISGSIDALPVTAVLKRIGVGKKASDEITDKVVSGLVGTMGKQAALEAPTEAIQESIAVVALQWVDENREFFTPETYSRLRTAAAAGAIGGASIGGGMHVLSGGPLRKKTMAVEPITPPLDEGPPPQNVDEAIAKGKEALDLGRVLPGDPSLYPGDQEQYFEPLIKESEVSQLKPGETPVMPARSPQAGILGLIDVAEKMGFSEEAVRLRGANELYKRVAEASARGNNKLAGRLADRANKIRADILEQPAIEQEFANQYPAEYTFMVEGVEGALPATTNNPNFTMPEADIEGRYQRVESLLEGPISTTPITENQAGEVSSASESEMVSPEEEAKLKQSAERSERAKRLKIIDTDKDSLRVAVTKLAGLNKDAQEQITGGFSQNRNVPGVGFVFSKNGTSLDDMAMLLHEQGYIPAAEMDNLGGVPYITEKLGAELSGMGMTYAPGSKAEAAELERQEFDARESEESLVIIEVKDALAKAQSEREAIDAQLKSLEESYPEAIVGKSKSKFEREVEEYYESNRSEAVEQLPSEGSLVEAKQQAPEDYQAAGIDHTQDQAVGVEAKSPELKLATETDGIKAEKPTAKESKAADDKAQIDRERDYFGLEAQDNQPKSTGAQESLSLAGEQDEVKAPRPKAKTSTALNEIMVTARDGTQQTADKVLAASVKRLDALYALKACINAS